jgi:1,4-dihydroxy-2-naphthoate octaprenyltransferase
MPVLLGSFAGSWRTGTLALDRFGLTLGAVLCVHLGANLANDFFDAITGCDRLNPEPTPFSGGSRVIQDGLIASRTILTASVVFFGLGLAQGIVLNSMVPGNRLLLLGLLGLGCGVVYTALPFKLSYRGLGEVVIFFAFGPLTVAGSYLAQTGESGFFPLLISVPAGLLVLSILLVNEVLDLKWDMCASKRTLVVRVGEQRAYLLFLIAYVGAFGWLALGLVMDWYPVAAIAAFLPSALLFGQLVPGKALRNRAATVRASRATILSQVSATGLVALSYLL